MDSSKKDCGKLERDAFIVRSLVMAHAYAPAYAMVSMVVVPELAGERGGLKSPLIAALYAIPAFTILTLKHRVAHYFAQRPRWEPLVLGLGVMSIGCFATGMSFVLLKLGITHGWGTFMLFAACQLPIGLALALVDGPDQDLIRLAWRRDSNAGPSAMLPVYVSDRDTRARSLGVTSAAVVGAIAAAVALSTGPILLEGEGAVDPKGAVATAGAVVFFLTALSQIGVMFAMIRLWPRIAPPAAVDNTDRKSKPKIDSNEVEPAASCISSPDPQAAQGQTRRLADFAGAVDGVMVFFGIVLSALALGELIRLYGDAWGPGTAILCAGAVAIIASGEMVGNLVASAIARRHEAAYSGTGDSDDFWTAVGLRVVALGVTLVTAFLIARSQFGAVHSDEQAREAWLVIGCAMSFSAVALRGFTRATFTREINRSVSVAESDLLVIRARVSIRSKLSQCLTSVVAVGSVVLLAFTTRSHDETSSEQSTAPDLLKHTLTIATAFALIMIGSLIIGAFRRDAWRRVITVIGGALVSGAPSRESLRGAIRECGRPLTIANATTFAALLFAANWLDETTPSGGLVFVIGGIPYALAFLSLDLAVERYGQLAIIPFLLIGGLINGLGTLILSDNGLNTFVASTCSMTPSIILEASVYLLLRKLCPRRDAWTLWARVVLTTFATQAVDTLIFISAREYFAVGTLVIDTKLAELIHGQMLIKWAAVAICGWVPVWAIAIARRLLKGDTAGVESFDRS